jgi:hypothetical protein
VGACSRLDLTCGSGFAGGPAGLPVSVAAGRLTCGQHHNQAPFAQVRPKRKDLAISDLRVLFQL